MEPKSGKSSKTGNPWMIQEYVLEIPGQYPQHCMFSIYGEDRIKQMNVQMGEDLTIQFDIDGAHKTHNRMVKTLHFPHLWNLRKEELMFYLSELKGLYKLYYGE